MNASSSKQIIKIQAAIAFLLVSTAILLASGNPANGYEASIYTALPISLWITLFSLMIGGITVVVHQVLSGAYKSSKLWLVGVLEILLAYVISLSLHMIRGYYMWGMCGDAATHLGNINTILLFNTVPQSLHYPAIHIFSSSFTLIAGVNPVQLHMPLPLVYSVLFVALMVIFAKELLPQLSQRIFVLVISCLLVHESYHFFTPNTFANLTSLILFYLLAKINMMHIGSSPNKEEYRFLMILLVLLYPLLHTVAVLAFISVLFGLIYSDKATRFIDRLFQYKSSFRSNSGSDYVVLLGFTIIWLIIWQSSFNIWDVNISNTFSVFTGVGSSSLTALVAKSEYAASHGYNPLTQVIKQYGVFIFFAILTAIAILLLRRDLAKADKKTVNLFQFWFPAACLIMMMGLLFLIRFNFSPLRLIFFIEVIMIPFVAYLTDRTIRWVYAKRKNPRTLRIVAVILIIGMTGIYAHGLVKMYPSPYTLQNSLQTTHQEVEGMRWVFEEKNGNAGLSGINAAPGRFMDMLYHPGHRGSEGVSMYLRQEEVVPYHFGYDTNTTLFESFHREFYMLISERDRRMYVDTYPAMAGIRWYQEDFNRLHLDPGLNHIYSNEGFDIWKIFDTERSPDRR